METAKTALAARAQALLAGAYDLHMHAAPSPFQRLLDDFGLVGEAGEAGMAGVVLKSHYESTAARAQLVNTHSGSAARAFGGIVLNWPVGGLNPYAVENALRRDARLVWMPTRDSANSLSSGDMPGDFFRRPGISILTEDGTLKPETEAVLEVMGRYNAALATGHLSPEESVVLCREGVRRGVRMVLTHPEFSRTIVPAEVQRELAQLGVWVEKCWYNIAEGECSAAAMAQHIRTVGPEHCFLSTDRGQGNRERPVEAMIRFLSALLEEGIPEQDLAVMVRDVPRQVLGLN